MYNDRCHVYMETFTVPFTQRRSQFQSGLGSLLHAIPLLLSPHCHLPLNLILPIKGQNAQINLVQGRQKAEGVWIKFIAR